MTDEETSSDTLHDAQIDADNAVSPWRRSTRNRQVARNAIEVLEQREEQVERLKAALQKYHSWLEMFHAAGGRENHHPSCTLCGFMDEAEGVLGEFDSDDN